MKLKDSSVTLTNTHRGYSVFCSCSITLTLCVVVCHGGSGDNIAHWLVSKSSTCSWSSKTLTTGLLSAMLRLGFVHDNRGDHKKRGWREIKENNRKKSKRDRKQWHLKRERGREKESMPVKEINQQSHFFYRVECTCSRSLITMPIMEHVSSSCQFSCPWQWVGCSVSTTNTTHSVQTLFLVTYCMYLPVLRNNLWRTGLSVWICEFLHRMWAL